MKNSLPTLFKTLLATTSALALVSGSSNTALAVSRTSQNAISDIAVPADWNPNGFNSGDALVYGGNHTIQANGLGPFSINFIDTAAIPLVGNFIITNTNLQLGSVGSTGGGGGVPIVMGAGGNLTLTTTAGGGGILPNDYSKFASLDFSNIPGATLTVQNTAPITLPTNFLSSGGDAGKIVLSNGFATTFNGTFSAAAGTQVSQIYINSGSTAVFNTDLTTSGSLFLNTGATLQFGPNITVTVDDIIFQDWPTPSCNVIFKGDTLFNARIGQQADQVYIGNGEVNITNDDITANDINFTSVNSSIKLSYLGNNLYGNLNNTTGIDGKGKLKVANSIATVWNQIGAPGAGFENINFEGDNKIVIRNNNIYVQTITTDVDGGGMLVIRSDLNKDIVADIGTASKKLKRITPTRDTVSMDTLTTLKNGIKVYANELELYSNFDIGGVFMDSSKLIMEDNVFIDAPITTYNQTFFSGLTNSWHVFQAEVDVLSNATILQDIGTTAEKLQNIKLQGAPGSRVDLSGDFYSASINLQQPNIVFGDDVLFDGEVTSISTTYSIGNHTISFDDSGNSQIQGNPVVNFTVDDNKFGHFVVKGGVVDMNSGGMSNLTLNLTDLAVILPPVGPVGQSYIVFGMVENAGQITVMPDSKAQFNIVQQNPFVTWSYTNGVATRRRLAQNEINQQLQQNIQSPTALANAILLSHPDNTGDASAMFQNVTGAIMNNEDVEKTLKLPIVEAAEQVSEAIDQATSSIENRLRSLGMPAFNLAQGEEEGGGVAAGDDGYKNGAWVNAYYGAVRQKARGEAAGFKSNIAGVMFGADTMITDEHTIGMALGYSDNKVKHKDDNDGDTSRVKTYTISIYGMHDISDKWFVQGVGLFSRNAINNREQRFLQGGGVEVARGDFDVNAYGTEILVGHNHLVTDKVLMTTTMGMEYLRLSGSRYKETGTTNQNLLITKKNDNKLNAIIGTGFSYDGSFKGYTTIPEMHGNIYYDVLNQTPRVAVQVAGLVGDRLLNKTAEQTRAFYNLGGGLSVLRGATEFSAGYDLYLGKKYIGHQGTLKVRVNF